MRCGAAGGPLDTPDGPCRPRCFGDGRDARPTYFNEQMPARFLMPVPKVRPKYLLG